MGSWNETCMLSHLQIMQGDAVKAIILVNNNENANESTQIYYNESYSPLTLPIDAEYNDYGSVENEKIPEYTDKLLRNLTFADKDGTKYEYDNLTDFINDINSYNGLYLKEICCKPKKLECIFIHDALYDILISKMKDRIPYKQTKTLYELYEDRNQEIKALWTEYNNNLDDFKKGFMLQDKINNKLFKVSCYGYSFPSEYLLLTESVTELNCNDFFAEFNKYILFANALNAGRYGYITRCGAGGQDLDCSIQTAVANFVLEFSKRTNEDGDRIYCDEETIFWY
mgnify:CR=1 FL=1